MATFGTADTTSGADATSGANYKIASKFTLSEDGTVSKLSFYGYSTGGASNVRGVIYADSAGAPAARQAVSNELTIPDLAGVVWQDLTFASGVPLTAGDYWLGYICDSGSIRYYAHSVTNNRKYRAETYSGSPADPFGSVDGTDNFEITIYATYSTAAQTLVPSADSVDGAWTDQAGGTNLSGSIDETTASDSDYIQSELAPSASGCRVKLAAGGDPVSSSGHEINWRAGKNTTGGQTVNLTVKLYQGGGNSLGGGTLIADFDRNGVDAMTNYTETLSGGEADAITDYTDLYLEFYATAT